MKISLKFERDKFANKFVTYCRLIDTGVYLSYIFYSMSVSARESEELHLQENIRIPFYRPATLSFLDVRAPEQLTSTSDSLLRDGLVAQKNETVLSLCLGKGIKSRTAVASNAHVHANRCIFRGRRNCRIINYSKYELGLSPNLIVQFIIFVIVHYFS